MRIINLCFSQPAGVAYCLSHAINKYSKHQAINIRSTTTFVQYPTIAEMKNYDVATVREMVYNADLVVFHCAVWPFFSGLSINPEKLAGKKKILYLHGTELRYYGKEILGQADKYIGDYEVVVSTPDLLMYAPEGAHWVPAVRSFSEISKTYKLCNQDREALESFGVERKKVVFCHASTSEVKKGSKTFYTALTRVMQELPYVNFLTIRRQPWATCLRLLSDVDVCLDQDPPFTGSYGTIAVEASVFKMPVITRMFKPVTDIMKRETGLDSPFITFKDLDDLIAKCYLLAEDSNLREKFGSKTYRYCKAVHDEKPVVDKFLKIVEAMA